MRRTWNRCKIMVTLLICGTLIPIDIIHGAPPITPDINSEAWVWVGSGVGFDCGAGATSCPDNIFIEWDVGEGSAVAANKFVDVVGSKPIPTRPGYSFVDWKISYIQALTAYNGSKLKVGDLMTDWESYELQHLFSDDWSSYQDSSAATSGEHLILEAVWEPAFSEQQNSIPISVSVAATPINVTLPTRIDIAFNTTSVEGQIADSLLITNNGKTGNVIVQNVRAELTNPKWAFTTQTADSYFQLLPLDSNQIYLGFSKDNSTYTTLSEQSFDPGMMIPPVGLITPNFSPFYLKVKTGGRSSSIQESVMNLVLTIGFDSATPDTGLEISDGTVTAYTGNSETLILPMNVTSINSKALAGHPELKTVINNTGRSFDWFDALGETDPRDIPTPAFSEGSTNNVLIASQTTMDNYSEPFRSQLLSGEIKLTPDSTLTIDSSGMITDFSRKTDSIKADVVLPATKNGVLIKGIDDGTKDGNKINGVSAALIITPQAEYKSPFMTLSLGRFDSQNGGINSITMPDSIEKLGALSLASYTSPITIKNIPSSLKSVGMGSFLFTIFDKNIADFSHTQLQVIDAYAFTLDYMKGNTSVLTHSNVTEIRLPDTIQTINPNAFLKNFMPDLTTIINPSGRSFDWSAITGSTTSRQNFATGWVSHKNGDIAVRSSSDMYIISYDLNGHGDMDGLVTSYTPRTETFTIYGVNSSVEDGGCLWNGWSTPTDPTIHSSVTIEKGSTGDRKYIANWGRCEPTR